MTSKPGHVKTRFLVISDTHSASPEQNVNRNGAPFRPPLPKADVLLHCGDLTMIGLLQEYEKTLDMLGSIDAKLKLVIAGNHDLTLDDVYYQRKGPYMHRSHGFDPQMPAKAKEMWTGERARRAGVTYLEEGTHTFRLANGAQLRVRGLIKQCAHCNADRIPRSMPPRTNQNSATGHSRIFDMRIVTTLLTTVLPILYQLRITQFQISPP